jgi:hypothetical protein
MTESKEHRGRVQGQGANVEESVSWSQDAPPTVEDGLRFIDELHGLLTRREAELREAGFQQARAAVRRAGGGGGVPKDRRYPWAKSYPQPPRRDGRRVDIEVHAGTAFVP